MVCIACTRNQGDGYIDENSLLTPPYNSTDLMVYENGKTRKFDSSDWPSNRHKLLLFYPETNTPVCKTEMGAINQWVSSFNDLGCDIYSCTTDSIELVKQWYETEESIKDPQYKVLSSYVLPSRLGIMNGTRNKRASVFITSDGDVVKQEHFMKVGRSIAELHRMMYAYTTNNYCAEGWISPSDGFIS